MDNQLNIAIVGSTGVIGSEILSVINDKQLSLGDVRLLASENSEGEVYDVLGDEVKVETLEEDEDFSDDNIVIFAVKADLAEQYIPKALETGAKVIDVSSFYRLKPESFLAARGFNVDQINKDTKLVSSPNVVTLQLVPFLKTVSDSYGIKRVSVTVLQSVATAGKAALDELWDQTMAVFRQSEIVCESFQHQIAFNCFPQIGVFMKNGYTSEEISIADEVRRLLEMPKLPVSVTAVRIPIFHGSSLSVNVETEKGLSSSILLTIIQYHFLLQQVKTILSVECVAAMLEMTS